MLEGKTDRSTHTQTHVFRQDFGDASNQKCVPHCPIHTHFSIFSVSSMILIGLKTLLNIYTIYHISLVCAVLQLNKAIVP